MNVYSQHLHSFLSQVRSKAKSILIVMLATILLASCVPDTDRSIRASNSRNKLTEGEIIDRSAKDDFAVVETYPLPWPLDLPTSQQLVEARECDVDGIHPERYPEDVGFETLREHFPIDERLACDWAILAVAYSHRPRFRPVDVGDGHLAWANAVNLNPAFALLDPMLFAYFEAPAGVSVPPLPSTALQEIEIDYEWFGEGEPVSWNVTITADQQRPNIEGTRVDESSNASADPVLLNSLASALDGLIPVDVAEPIVVCYDNHPNWSITLNYEDGAKLELTNKESNIYDLGGPWWVEIDEQLYFTYSSTFVDVLYDVIADASLPLGEPAAMFCHGLDEPLVDLLYSR